MSERGHGARSKDASLVSRNACAAPVTVPGATSSSHPNASLADRPHVRTRKQPASTALRRQVESQWTATARGTKPLAAAACGDACAPPMASYTSGNRSASLATASTGCGRGRTGGFFLSEGGGLGPLRPVLDDDMNATVPPRSTFGGAVEGRTGASMAWTLRGEETVDGERVSSRGESTGESARGCKDPSTSTYTPAAPCTPTAPCSGSLARSVGLR